MTRARDLADTQDNLGGAVPPFVAGKNKIINGNFGIWQRGTTSTSTGYFTADRWYCATDATATYSQQAFTPGAAPVAGYEGQYFMRLAKNSGGSYVDMRQYVEDVRTLAGQTLTLSFWAKCGSGTESLEPYYSQDFGSGGSGGVSNSVTAQTITSSWARYSFTFTMPSVSGKTIGANSFTLIYVARSIASSTARTIDVWGVQLESGSVATPFTPAGGGSQQAELALCQRYYWRANAINSYAPFGVGAAYSTTAAQVIIPYPVSMRNGQVASVDYANLGMTNAGAGVITFSGLSFGNTTPNSAMLNLTGGSGLVGGDSVLLIANNSTAAYIGFSAEL
jgi:hypothetical protein